MANLALANQKDRKVIVSREKLIKTLKSNRDKHLAEYHDAVGGYKELAEQKIRKAHEDAQRSLEKNLQRSLTDLAEFNPEGDEQRSDWLTLVQQINVELKVPRNFTKEYDAAIDMAEWDTRDELELTHAEFQCFVRDVWEWTDDFKLVSMRYNKKL